MKRKLFIFALFFGVIFYLFLMNPLSATIIQPSTDFSETGKTNNDNNQVAKMRLRADSQDTFWWLKIMARGQGDDISNVKLGIDPIAQAYPHPPTLPGVSVVIKIKGGDSGYTEDLRIPGAVQEVWALTVLVVGPTWDGYGVISDSRCICMPEGYYTATLAGDPDDFNPYVPSALEKSNIFKMLIKAVGQGGNVSSINIGMDLVVVAYSCPPAPPPEFTVVLKQKFGADEYCADIRAVGSEREVWELSVMVAGQAMGGSADSSQPGFFPELSWDSNVIRPGQTMDLRLGDANGPVLADMKTTTTYQTKKTDASQYIPSINFAIFSYFVVFETTSRYYRDIDGDGYGDPDDYIDAEEQPIGYVIDSSDCNDNDPNVNPSAEELIDGVDNNCNGQIDEGAVTYYQDADGDGFGDDNNTIIALSQPTGYVLTGDDCNDSDPNINPQAEEVYDGVDNNCNSQIDEGAVTYYRDADGDGFGDDNDTIIALSQPIGYVLTGDDCNDMDSNINPQAEEVDDGIDNNCNGRIDEVGKTYVTVAADHDIVVESDYEYFSIEYLATAYFEIKFDIKAVKGTGTEDVEIILIPDNDPGDVEVEDDDTFIYYIGDDAYSTNMTTYDTIGTNTNDDIEIPAFASLFILAAFEDSDWEDYTWTGSEIEKITVTLVAGFTSLTDKLKIKEYTFEDTFGDDHDDSQNFSDYTSLSDADWDTLGGAPVIDTSDDTLYLRSSQNYYGDKDGDGFEYPDDCDNTDPNTYPGAQEICDGKDNDCNGLIPANELDKDSDGFMVCGGDCDDNDSTIYPGAYGTNRGIDNNCNDIIDDSEKRRFSYSLDARMFPLWMQSQQLGIIPFLPVYPDYPQIQRQMWYPYQLTFSQQQLIKTKPSFFHPALFSWLLNLNCYPFYSPFVSFDMDARYDINFNQYSNSIIFSPFVFESHQENEKTQTITLLSIVIDPDKITLKSGEASQLTVTGYYSDGSMIDLTNDVATIYLSTNQDVVKVLNDGKVTAVGEGNSIVTVKNSDKTDQISITVEDVTDEIPDIKGDWAGTWEASLTDPNEGVVTDPNGQIVINMFGDIRFHISEQTSAGGAVLGTIEITGWDVDPQPQYWPGDWTGKFDEVVLTGWIDSVSRFLKASYYYYVGKEDSGDFDVNEGMANLVDRFVWSFDSNKLKITDTTISGQLIITGYEYYVIGTFNVEKEDIQYLQRHK